MVGGGRPLKRASYRPCGWACGGLATTSEPTPAACAGTTFITTLDGYTAFPPGTYRPTRSTGTHRSVTVAPGPSVVVTSDRRWSACTARVRSIATSSAARTSLARPASAASNSAAGTRTLGGRTPSNDSPYSSAASAPRWATASTIGGTDGSAASTSTPPRGNAARSRAVESSLPRRSMRAITFTSTIVPDGSNGFSFRGVRAGGQRRPRVSASLHQNQGDSGKPETRTRFDVVESWRNPATA